MVFPAWSARQQHCQNKGNAGGLPQPPPSRACNLSLGDYFCLGAVVELVGSLGVEPVRCREELII